MGVKPAWKGTFCATAAHHTWEGLSTETHEVQQRPETQGREEQVEHTQLYVCDDGIQFLTHQFKPTGHTAHVVMCVIPMFRKLTLKPNNYLSLQAARWQQTQDSGGVLLMGELYRQQKPHNTSHFL